ncbi:MAG: DUF2155 domain-containing protein [Sphingomonadaceae bacterium]
MKRFLPILPVLLLAACGSSGDSEAEAALEAAKKAEAPAKKAAPAKKKAEEEPEVTAETGTPNEDRVATIGILNKRNNLSEDLTMKPGEARRFGKAVVRLESCERTPQWETVPETGAFVQVFVEEAAGSGEDKIRKVFSGWLFKNSPSLNVVEHPIYDVWVKDCAMRYPGEASPGAASSEEKASSSEGGDSSDE